MRGSTSAQGEKQLGMLVLLFGLFLLAAYHFEKHGQEIGSAVSPTSFNTKAKGVRGLSLLLQSQGYTSVPMESTWDSLNSETGLLVMIEPFTRKVETSEISSLKRWVEQGGTALYLISSPARPLDTADTIFGTVAVIPGDPHPQSLPISIPDNTYFNQVHSLYLQSEVRLAPSSSSGFRIDARDKSGILIMHRSLGKGKLVVAAAVNLASNDGIQADDNAIFLMNVANAACKNSSFTVSFDEYHHEVGFESKGQSLGIISYAPRSVRWVFWQFVILMGLLVYNGNRRFGRPRISSPPVFRRSSEYIRAMSRFIRKAHGADVALIPIYLQFIKELQEACHLTGDTPVDRLLDETSRHTGLDRTQIALIIQRCEEVVGGARIFEAELMNLCNHMESIKRSL